MADNSLRKYADDSSSARDTAGKAQQSDNPSDYSHTAERHQADAAGVDVTEQEDKWKAYEVAKDAIERGRAPRVDTAGAIKLDNGEFCHLVVKGCAYSVGHMSESGTLFITNRRLCFIFDRSGNQATLPLRNVRSCRLDFWGIAIIVNDNRLADQFASYLTTSNIIRDSILAGLIGKLAGVDVTRQRQDWKSYEAVREAIEKGQPLTVDDVAGEVKLDPGEVCHLAVTGCGSRMGSTIGTGKLLITTKRVLFVSESTGSQANLPLRNILSCESSRQGIGITVDDSGLASHFPDSLTTSDIVCDYALARLIGTVASMARLREASRDGGSPESTAAVASFVASHVKLGFPKTTFEVYVDRECVIHVACEGAPETDDMRSYLRTLVMRRQIPNVEFDFQHTERQVSRERESPQGAPSAVSSVASRLKLAFPETTFEVYSQNTDVVHVAWRGTPPTDEVRSFLQTLRLGHQIPNVDFNFHHPDTKEPSRSSASGGKYHAGPGSQAEEVLQKGPYEILGVGAGATLDEITQAYRREAQKNHPDKVATMAPEFRDLAERRMKELNAAYQKLKQQRK